MKPPDLSRIESQMAELQQRVALLEQRVDAADQTLAAVVSQAATACSQHTQFARRTDDELAMISSRLQSALLSVDALVATAENEALRERAKRVCRHARQNLTRIRTVQSKRSGGPEHS